MLLGMLTLLGDTSATIHYPSINDVSALALSIGQCLHKLVSCLSCMFTLLEHCTVPIISFCSIFFVEGSLIDKKRSRLKTLDEYYYIKGASDVHPKVYGELTRIALEDRAKEIVLRDARKRLVFLLFIVLLEAVLLCGVLRHSVLCENYPIFLHPLLLLTGCREGGRGTTCKMYEVAVQKPNPLREVAVATMSNDDRNDRIDEMTIQKVTDSADEKDEFQLEDATKESQHINNTVKASNSKKNVESWTTLLSRWLWNWQWSWEWKWRAHQYTRQMPPCVWGRCNFLLRPHLPWGIGLRRPALPTTIDSEPFDSPPKHGAV